MRDMLGAVHRMLRDSRWETIELRVTCEIVLSTAWGSSAQRSYTLNSPLCFLQYDIPGYHYW